MESNESAGVVAGGRVDVEIELGTEPREVTVPADLSAAIDGDAEARLFDGLSYTHQRWYVDWIESAKTADTRERRVSHALGKLREGRVQA